MIRLPLAFAAVILMAACSSATNVQSNQWKSGVPSAFQYAGAAGPVPMIVVGNPFAVENAAVSRVVAEASTWTYGTGAVMRFAPSSTTDGLRVIWHLSAPLAQNGPTLCAGRTAAAGASAAPEKGQRIMGAFCSGDTALADVTVRLPAAPAGPDDAMWRRAFSQALMSMVPAMDPFEDLEAS